LSNFLGLDSGFVRGCTGATPVSTSTLRRDT
jgi:hypothetical protein